MVIQAVVDKRFAILAAIVFAAGFARAVILPYMSLVAIDAIGLSPWQFGALTFITSVVSVVISIGVGYLSDQVKQRSLLIVGSALIGILAYSAVWYFANPLVFVVCFALLMPLSSTVFYQSFALAKTIWNDNGDKLSGFFVTLLRGIFTLSWVIGPPIAGYLVLDRPLIAVFLLSAMGYLVCAVSGFLSSRILQERSLAQVKTPVGASHMRAELRKTIAPTILVSVGIVGLIDAALQLHSMSFALFITRRLSGSATDVGLMSGALAAVEVLCTPVVAVAIRRIEKIKLVVFFCVLYACYLGLIGISQSLTQVFLLQVLNAAAIAGLFSVSLNFVQSLIRGSPGLSTSLTAVAEVIGAGIASLVFVVCVHFDAITATFFSAAALCLLAGLAISMLPATVTAEPSQGEIIES